MKQSFTISTLIIFSRLESNFAFQKLRKIVFGPDWNLKSFRLIKLTSNTCFGNLFKNAWSLALQQDVAYFWALRLFSPLGRSRHAAEASAFFKKYLYKCIHEFPSVAQEKIEDKCEEKFLAS